MGTATTIRSEAFEREVQVGDVGTGILTDVLTFRRVQLPLSAFAGVDPTLVVDAVRGLALRMDAVSSSGQVVIDDIGFLTKFLVTFPGPQPGPDAATERTAAYADRGGA